MNFRFFCVFLCGRRADLLQFCADGGVAGARLETYNYITKMAEVEEVRPNLSEPFYTTTVCVCLASVAIRYQRKHTYILPETLLLRRTHYYNR
jgi:hypothetical protein